MISKEEVIAIEKYCSENNVSKARRISELGIPISQFYHSKRKYIDQQNELESFNGNRGGFMELSLPTDNCSNKLTSRQLGKKEKAKSLSSLQAQFMTLEMRFPSGVEMRLQGGMSPLHIKELITNLK